MIPAIVLATVRGATQERRRRVNCDDHAERIRADTKAPGMLFHGINYKLYAFRLTLVRG